MFRNDVARGMLHSHIQDVKSNSDQPDHQLLHFSMNPFSS